MTGFPSSWEWRLPMSHASADAPAPHPHRHPDAYPASFHTPSDINTDTHTPFCPPPPPRVQSHFHLRPCLLSPIPTAIHTATPVHTETHHVQTRPHSPFPQTTSLPLFRLHSHPHPKAARRAPQPPPRWSAFDEADVCMCCYSDFTWACTSHSEAQQALQRKNCYHCGALVCPECSRTERSAPEMGVIFPRRMCDRCSLNLTDSYLLPNEKACPRPQGEAYQQDHLPAQDSAERQVTSCALHSLELHEASTYPSHTHARTHAH